MPDIKSKLAARLTKDDTNERCGFVTSRGRVVEVLNVAPDPTKAFKIPAPDVMHWLAKGVVATWHTHPESDANLSGDDYSCFLSWDDLDHYIIGRDGIRLYRVEDGMVVQA